ncbi:O-antigen ligase [Synechococcus sp. BIOS-E4-1]|uniref:O-antigen ligase family protein n=1 Tax=Synechococcus sp. BIOS-E4-1 TaxID=1400864 RepID=UPI001646B113|nr:O-antigen ligase family protein [Synechococcus sp. BIOS-E4-1]
MTGLTERLTSPWLDLLLPLSLSGLLWERSGNPAGMVLILAIWCGLKFLRWLPVEPVYGVLVGVLVVSLSAVIHPISGSAPTDLIVVLLAFAAGLKQSKDQWRVGLWLILATVIVSLPFVEFDRFNSNLTAIPWSVVRDVLPQEAVRIQRITINRTGYLYGLFALVGYGLFVSEIRPWLSRLAAVVAMLSFVLALGAASRAAFLFPLAAVIVTELCWRNRQWVARRARSLAAFVLVLSLLFNLALYWPGSPIVAEEPSDVGRAQVAQCFVSQSLSSLPDLLMGQGYDRVSDHCAKKVFLPGRSSGIPHAHNVFLHALADQGLVALILMLMAVWLVFQRLFLGLAGEAESLCRTGLACALFILAASLVESTLLKTSLQQVISGYLLAIAWVAPTPSKQENFRTIG